MLFFMSKVLLRHFKLCYVMPHDDLSHRVRIKVKAAAFKVGQIDRLVSYLQESLEVMIISGEFSNLVSRYGSGSM